ncbi:sensor histidine kinase [Cohnella herbarum]|uniref:histidine kinase n=1 Tax=Cohnella herbarum TaxID=2728023 RepID=A0A7Z2VKD9_9BACL|nr:sensor histidine kinase [Cohnella herbarum]QJD84866.1 sensor histidine kinase [Cohnella herbarum]
MPANLKYWYLGLSIRSKFQLWFLPLLLVASGSIGFFSYTTASNQVLEKVSQAQENISSQTISHLDYLAKDIHDIYNYLSLSSELHDLLSPEPTFNSAIIVNSMINRLLSTRQFFQSLLIFSDGHQTIKFNSLNNNEIISFEEYKKSRIYENTVNDVVSGAWGVEEGPLKLFIGDQRRKVFYSKVLVNPENLVKEGLLVIGMTEEDFRQSYGRAKENVEIVIVNGDGTILSDSDGKWSGSSFEQLPYYDHVPIEQVDWSNHDGEWLISHSSSEVTGWHVLVIQPRTEQLMQLNAIRWLTIGLMLLILLMNAPLSWTISRLFLQPLKKILKSMREVQAGDFSQQVDVTLRDEIGQLGNGYNIMVTRIRELIQDVYQSEISKKESELRLLQSQINPHFLYNTLNSIAWMSYREGAEKTADMIQKLSDFFRYNLSQGADIISLSKELNIVESYLYLSKIRFADKLTYSIEVAQRLSDVLVPKLILQPLVENAVVHGIEQIDEQGFVHVSVRESSGDLHIEVTDNGMGIAPDRLDKLRSAIRSEKRAAHYEDTGGFALLNLRDRLVNHFGDGAGIEIDSKRNIGTTVKMVIPFRHLESEDMRSDGRV